jgi:ABC-type multidrug transport system ATPase subunit
MLKIEASHISARFDGREVLKDISFKLESKSDGSSTIFGLMGPSGSGKTTLLRFLLDPSEQPTAGHVEIEPKSAIVSYVPQTPVLFEDRSILDNARYLSVAGKNKGRYDERAMLRLAERLSMVDLLKSRSPVDRLSGGEKQRLMLLRALSIRPSLLLLDEPCSGLDPGLRQEFLTALLDVARTERLMIIYVSHHWTEISRMCEVVAFMDGASRKAPTSRMFLSDLSTFAAHPPTLTAAKFVCEPKLNLISARKSSNNIFEAVGYGGTHSIGFPIVSLRSLGGNGVGYDVLSKGPIYREAKISGIDTPITVWSESIVQPLQSRMLEPPRAWVYDPSCTLVGEGYLTVHESEGGTCLKISPM